MKYKARFCERGWDPCKATHPFTLSHTRGGLSFDFFTYTFYHKKNLSLIKTYFHKCDIYDNISTNDKNKIFFYCTSSRVLLTLVWVADNSLVNNV